MDLGSVFGAVLRPSTLHERVCRQSDPLDLLGQEAEGSGYFCASAHRSAVPTSGYGQVVVVGGGGGLAQGLGGGGGGGCVILLLHKVWFSGCFPQSLTPPPVPLQLTVSFPQPMRES